MTTNGYVAIYARQSIFKPDSISVDDQIEKSKALVTDGSPIITYKDMGYTGANTDRPDFQRMIKDIETGVIKKVIVWKLDRISRSVADFAQMLNTFQEYEVDFASVEEPCLTINDRGIGKAMLQVPMIFAEVERENIQTRVRENYYSRLELGMLGGGTAPYGYDRATHSINGKKCFMYVVNPTTSETVKEIFHRYGELDCSLRDLSHWLYTSDIETARGNLWSTTTIARMMKNPAYVKADAKVYMYLQGKGVHLNNSVDEYVGKYGIYLYGNRKIKGSTKRKAKYVDMNGDYATIAPHEGLIDAELWLKVQMRLNKNVHYGNSGNSTKCWLTGVAKCGYCGKAITFKQNKHYPIYVSCMGRQNKFCFERKAVLKVEELEATVEKGLLEFLKALPAKTERQKAKHVPEINSIETAIAKIETSIGNYIERLELAEGALITHINAKVNALEKERQELSARLVKLTVDANKPIDGGLNIDDVVAN